MNEASTGRAYLKDNGEENEIKGGARSLKSVRLSLRPITAVDRAALHRISNETGMRRFLWEDKPVEMTTIQDLISRSFRMFSPEGIGLFGIRRHGSESLIGF